MFDIIIRAFFIATAVYIIYRVGVLVGENLTMKRILKELQKTEDHLQEVIDKEEERLSEDEEKLRK